MMDWKEAALYGNNDQALRRTHSNRAWLQIQTNRPADGDLA